MRVEIAHDTLAKAIYGKASTEEKMRLRVQKMVRERYAFAQEQDGVWLQEIDLEVIGPIMEQLAVSAGEKQFIQESQQRIAQKKQQKVRLNFLLIVLPVAVIVVLGSIFTYQYKEAKEKEMLMATREKESTSAMTQQQTAQLRSLIDDRFRMLDKAKEQAVFIDRNKTYLVGMSRRGKDVDSLLPQARVSMPSLASGLNAAKVGEQGFISDMRASMGFDSDLEVDLLSDSVDLQENRVDSFLKAELEKLKREK